MKPFGFAIIAIASLYAATALDLARPGVVAHAIEIQTIALTLNR